MFKRSLLCLGIAALVSAPLVSQTRAEAEAFVKKAVAFGKANGKDKLIAEVNTPGGQFRKGELYIFILDDKHIILSHAGNIKLVGVDLSESKDPNGVLYVIELVKMAKTKGKGWVDYQFVNPETKKIQDKSSYVERFEDVCIGCGIYLKK